jgi:glyoxylase-like metal-dependent hydrolase (beta-lactamase superfamily II)
MFKKLFAGATTAALAASLSIGVAAQNAAAVISSASMAMGVQNLNSITFSGTAQNANFGQSKSIGNPWAPTAITRITNYTRTLDFNQPASRAFGPTQPPQVPGAPAPMPGNLNQLITPMQQNWTQQLEIWITPWGFLKGATANNATVRQQGGRQVVSFSPAMKSPSGQPYTVTGYINNQNLVEKVETRVEHPVAGDLLVEAEYSDYRDANGVKYPARIVQKRAGLQTFEANITAASANPANLTELMTPPPAPARGGGAAAPGAAPAAGAAQAGRGGGPPAPPPVEAQKIGDGVFKITGNYAALAVDMGDHIVVVESGQSEARGLAVMAAAKQAIPGKPIRFVVNSHPHFDHASGLATAVAEGATILTHSNNEDFLEKALGNPRTLVGDSLAKANRKPNVEGVGDRRTLKGSNGKVIELYHVQGLEHSDGMLMVYLPAEKAVYTADFGIPNPPAAGAPAAPVNPALTTLVQNVDRLKLDFNAFLTAHPPNPDRPLTRADLMGAVGRSSTN